MLNVVVIDDRISSRNILTRLAMSIEEGIRVKSFSSPRPALAWLEQTIPDLMIFDVGMRDMNVLDFIAAFRALRDAGEVPLLVVGAPERRSDCHAALEAGASDFLLSPLDQLEFRARARNLLILRKQQKLLGERATALREDLNQRQARLALPSAERRLRRLLDATPTLINAVDAHGRLTHVNHAHKRVFGRDPGGLVGATLETLYGTDEATRHRVQNAKVFETGLALEGYEHDVLQRDGKARHRLFTTKSPLFDDAGRVAEVVTASPEIARSDHGEVRMRRQIDRDPLTDLPNRGVYRDYLENALIRALRRDARCALLLVDLDRFKGVNDAFGLSVGDLLLRSVAERLTYRLREIDVIGRLGGDQFVILQTDIKGQDDALVLAEELSESFSEPFMIEGEELHISASIGITLFPADGHRADRLLKNAELAMYRVGVVGRSRTSSMSSCKSATHSSRSVSSASSLHK
jgi:diguanylate cyclase (GGDEF)-like protein/PAS domain S-box-containing protein